LFCYSFSVQSCLCVSPSSGGPNGSLVEWFSGKPVELGPAPPEGQGSWQAGGRACLMPSGCLSQWGRAPVIPHGSGARQGLRGRELEGQVSSCPMCSWCSAWPEGWWAQGCSTEWPRARYPGVVWVSCWCVDPAQQRGGDPAMNGSGTRLWRGVAQGAENLAEWSCGSAGLQGRDLAGGCSFIGLWHGKAFHDLRA
jgi:hypothetical protein